MTLSLVEYMKEYQKALWWSYVIQAPFKVLGWCIDLVIPDEEEHEVDGAPIIYITMLASAFI